jgi:hypothetical protein
MTHVEARVPLRADSMPLALRLPETEGPCRCLLDRLRASAERMSNAAIRRLDFDLPLGYARLVKGRRAPLGVLPFPTPKRMPRAG